MLNPSALEDFGRLLTVEIQKIKEQVAIGTEKIVGEMAARGALNSGRAFAWRRMAIPSVMVTKMRLQKSYISYR